MTVNPAELGLTDAMYEVYKIVKARQKADMTSTSGNIAELWGNKNRSYVYRVLKVLTDKGLIERYSQRYYKLAEAK